MQKCDFSYIEITLLHGYSEYATNLQRNAFFREHFWRTTSVYYSKCRCYKCTGSL